MRTKHHRLWTKNAVMRVSLTPEEAREEGREEIKAKMRDHFDVYAPHAVSWWNAVNETIDHQITSRSKS